MVERPRFSELKNCEVIYLNDDTRAELERMNFRTRFYSKAYQSHGAYSRAQNPNYNYNVEIYEMIAISNTLALDTPIDPIQRFGYNFQEICERNVSMRCWSFDHKEIKEFEIYKQGVIK